ncbi:MAG: 5-(carboxyamino)imidazole ribonucleotide mutase [bacterium]
MAQDNSNPEVLIILGSKSDQEYLERAEKILVDFEIPFESHLSSAHRHHDKLAKIIKKAEDENVAVIIAGAGLAAHLPGVIASLTLIPVIGVPIPAGTLGGLDALLSIVQMPAGIPVATVGMGRMDNAALLAAQIIATSGNENLKQKLREYRNKWKTD